MEGFKALLEHQKENAVISDETYTTLVESADLVVGYLDPLRIVNEQQARAVILIEDNAESDIQEMAEVLAEYVEKSTGVILPVLTLGAYSDQEEQFEGQTRIHIGNHAPGTETHITNALAGLDPQSFMIHPHNDTLTITDQVPRKPLLVISSREICRNPSRILSE